LIQQKIRFLPIDEVLLQFDRLCEMFPDDPVPETYKGEVLLWAGRYGEAKSCFKAAMNKSYDTIWSWIGLGAAYGLEGDYRTAQKVFKQGIAKTNFEGPTVFVYRGEFHRKAQQFGAAKSDLDHAIMDKPQRLSAWINRALLDVALGSLESAALLSHEIQLKTPSLWVDAANKCSQSPVSPNSIPDVLETILEMMHGNRSSQIISYRAPTGQLRFANWESSDGPDAALEIWKRY